MRLATFNLLHGRSPADGRVDIRRVARAAIALDADVLALQEVDRGQARSGHADLTRLIAEATGAVAWRFEATLLGTPGGNWQPAGGPRPGDADGPAYGISLLSRLPVESWEVIRLPQCPIRSPVRAPGGRLRWLPDEPRIGLAALLATPTGPCTVLATHLSVLPGWNALQLRRLTRRLADLPGPRYLLGDLNLPAPLPHLVTGWRSLGAGPTYPSARPRVQLDHVLVSEDAPPVLAVRVAALELSDHRALVVDLGEWVDEPVARCPVGFRAGA